MARLGNAGVAHADAGSYEYAQKIHQWFTELEVELPVEIARRVQEAQATGADPGERGAASTYLTTDQPFGSWTSRFVSGLGRKFKT